MTRPLHQNALEGLLAMLGGFLLLGGIFGAINDARDMIPNVSAAAWATFIFILTGVAAHLWMKYRRPPWVSHSGHPIRLLRWGRNIYWGAGGMLLLIWVGAIMNIDSPPAPPQTPPPVQTSSSVHPIFNARDKRFKVLILPWEQECEFEGKTYNIGKLLRDQFDALSKRENIGLYAYYLPPSNELKNITAGIADSLMRYHHADHVLYGSYSFKECEGGTSDKICFNYQTNYKCWSPTNIESHTDNKMLDFDGLGDLREGKGYEEINYILRWVAGLAAMKQQHYPAAVAQLHKIKGFESKAEVLFQLGNCYYLMNDPANSRICNEKALEIDPGHVEAAVHLGIALANERKYDVARERFERVLKDNLGNIEALRNLGSLHQALGDTLAAKACFERILQTFYPETESNLANAGMIYMDMRDYARAVACYERSLQMHGSHADRWTNLAIAYEHLKDTSRAERHFQNALKVDPTYAPAWYHLGVLSFYGKSNQGAQLYLEKAVQFNPSNNEAWAILGLNSCTIAQTEKGKRCLEKAYSINPTAYSTLYWSFAVYNKSRDYPKAKHFLQQLLALHPNNAQLWNELGVINRQMNNHEEAIACFKKTLKGLPDNGAVYYNLASASSCRRDKENALNYLSRAVALEPSMKQYIDKDESFDWLRETEEFLAILR